MRYIGIGTKAYFGYAASLHWMQQLRELVDVRPDAGAGADAGTGADAVQLFVVPSFPVLESAVRIFAGTRVWVGAQTSGWGGGALTGEVDPALLAEMGIRLVETGHAERRALFGEDAAVIRRKTTAVLASGLIPLLCVGEPEPSEPDQAADRCFHQLEDALGAELTEIDRIMLAYEPVWAIGQDKPAPATQVNEVLWRLRELIAAACPAGSAPPPILYGGAAGPGLLPLLPEADGLFLGRSAHRLQNIPIVLAEAARAPKRIEA
ncbi:MAG: triose-phosphate isomerase [Microbacteriaceae bacterium]